MTYREYYLEAKLADGNAAAAARAARRKLPLRLTWGMHKALATEAHLSEPTIRKAATGHPISYPTAWEILRALKRLDPRFIYDKNDVEAMCMGEITERPQRKVRAFGGRASDE